MRRAAEFRFFQFLEIHFKTNVLAAQYQQLGKKLISSSLAKFLFMLFDHISKFYLTMYQSYL